jgi:UDP-glucose 4-epimerase
MNNKTILITGGEGFIGSALALSLSSENKVISIDNHLNSFARERHENVTYFDANAKDISVVLNGIQPDIVYHLGEYARVESSFDKFDVILHNNYRQFFEICEYCNAVDAKLIYSGSSTIFSKPQSNYVPSPYQTFKKHNVEFLKDYSKYKNLKYAIVYFYNVYGPGEIAEGEFSTVIARFLHNVRSGLPLKVTLPGTQRRNFTHIDDIIKGLELVGMYGTGDNYGIGAKESYSIIEVAELISNNVVLTPAVPGNRNDAILKTEKIRSLGWCESNSLPEYLTEELKKCR